MAKHCRDFIRCYLALVLLWGLMVSAQAQDTGTVVRLGGPTAQGLPFDLSQLRGKIVMVFYWSTDCPVCRDKMSELRQNRAAWLGQPFELVLVSTDRREQDWREYERILSSAVPASQRPVQLWRAAAGFFDSMPEPTRLPTTLLLDKQGRLLKRFEGRIPADAWNEIADLL